MQNRQQFYRVNKAGSPSYPSLHGAAYPGISDLPRSRPQISAYNDCCEEVRVPTAPVQTMDDYIALQPPAAQVALERVRRAIAKAAPDAEECISYSIPAFRYKGRILLYFAGWKEHFSIYPASDAMVAALEGRLDEYRVSKGALRFPLGKA